LNKKRDTLSWSFLDSAFSSIEQARGEGEEMRDEDQGGYNDWADIGVGEYYDEENLNEFNFESKSSPSSKSMSKSRSRSTSKSMGSIKDVSSIGWNEEMNQLNTDSIEVNSPNPEKSFINSLDVTTYRVAKFIENIIDERNEKNFEEKIIAPKEHSGLFTFFLYTPYKAFILTNYNQFFFIF
jgi:hypothetical protein